MKKFLTYGDPSSNVGSGRVIIACLLAPWSGDLLDKPPGSLLVMKFLTFYGTQRFMTTFKRPCHLSLFWARSIQSMHLTLYKPLLSPICATCPAHLILLILITQIIVGEYRSLSSLLCSFLYPLHYLILLRPKYCRQHPILRHSQPMYLLHCEWPSFTPIQNNRQNYSSLF